MTYRFACSAFWGALAYDDIEVSFSGMGLLLTTATSSIHLGYCQGSVVEEHPVVHPERIRLQL